MALKLPAALATLLLVAHCSAYADAPRGTFSIVAFDAKTQELGVAVQSKYFSVGTDVPWAEAGVGAIATQATVNPSFGPKGLAMLKEGKSAAEVLKTLEASDPQWQSRQVGIVDSQGRAASHTGKNCIVWAGSHIGEGFACQGNILAGPGVVAGMAKAFQQTKGELAERLIAALEAGQAAGGDKRGMQSAAVLVVRPSATNPEFRERYVDLRVEDHASPIREIRRLWEIRAGFRGAGTHLLYANQYQAEGNAEMAKLERGRVAETLRRALARGERSPEMLNGLAWECAINGIFLADALKAAERAVALAPKNVDIIDTLAEVHYRQGHRAKAIEIETRALALDPKRKDIRDQLARFRAGKK